MSKPEKSESPFINSNQELPVSGFRQVSRRFPKTPCMKSTNLLFALSFLMNSESALDDLGLDRWEDKEHEVKIIPTITMRYFRRFDEVPRRLFDLIGAPRFKNLLLERCLASSGGSEWQCSQ